MAEFDVKAFETERDSAREAGNWKPRTTDLLAAYQNGIRDLYGADLRDANLYGADLRDANLYGANLRDADLRDADLRGANLRDADLRGANLRGANLRDADLYGADLRGANLRDADLRGANLYNAKGIFFIGSIGNSNRTIYAYIYGKQLRFRIGCRSCDLADARKAIKHDYANDDAQRKLYLSAVNLCVQWSKIEIAKHEND